MRILSRDTSAKLTFTCLMVICLFVLPIQASTFVVTSTGDSGPGTLRQAIIDANADVSPPATITFNIVGPPPFTIQPLTNLPLITANGILIDGRTQPGFVPGGDPVIIINGALDTDVAKAGLTLFGTTNATIHTLVINGFTGAFGPAININGGTNNAVYGSYLGTNQTGTSAVANNFGIIFSNIITSATIGGVNAGERNVISGNLQDGIRFNFGNGMTNIIIKNNFIGVDKTGLIALPNGANGIGVFGQLSDSTIGGLLSASESNVISGNTLSGILVQGDEGVIFTRNFIQGNFIGTDQSATVDLGNGANGITFFINQGGSSITSNIIRNNTVLNNNLFGIALSGTPNDLNSILLNSDANNFSNGIEIAFGANNNQQPPTVDAAAACVSGGSIIITSTAPSAPAGANFRLEFFANPIDRNPITEGRIPFGVITSLPAGATDTRVFTLPPGVTPGMWVSGTATNLNNIGGTVGDTSNYSLNTQIAPITITPSLEVTGSPICVGEDATLTLTITGGTPPYNVTWSDGLVQAGVTSPVVRTVSPTTTTNYSASVIDSNGCLSDSNTVTVVVDQLTITSQPVAIPSSICRGESSTITFSVTGVSPFTVEWSDGVTQANVTSPVVRTVTPTTTTIYSAQVTDSNGCQVTTSTTSVTVNGLPTAVLSALSTTICSGSGTVLELVMTGAAPFDVIWSDGFTQTNVDSPVGRTVFPTSTTDYSAIVTDNNGCQTTSNTITITVNQSPISATFAPFPDTICSGSSSTITVTVTGGTAPYTVVYTDGFTQTGDSPLVRTVTPTETTQYGLISLTDANGCTLPGLPNDVIVVVNPSPISATFTAFPNPLCTPSEGSVLTTTVSGGTGPYTVHYSDDFTQTEDSPITRTVFPTITTTYSILSLFDSNVCPLNTLPAPITLIVGEQITADLSGSSTVECPGQSVTLTLTITGVSPFNVEWSDGVVQVDVESPVTRVVSPTETTNYFAIVTDSNGCRRISNTVTITVSNALAAVLSASPDPICVGASSTLTLDITGTAPFTINWQDGFTQITDNAIVTRVVAPEETTRYFAQVIDANGCTTESNPVNLEVNPLPSVALAVSQHKIAQCQPVVLTARPTGEGPFTVVWSDGVVQDNIATAAKRTVRPEKTTSYSATVIDRNGCRARASQDVTVVVAQFGNASPISEAIINKYCCSR